jgi:hypothetical protein
MLKRRTWIAGCLTVLALLVSTSTATSVDAEEPKVRLAVVVAKDSTISELSLYDLKRLYKGEPINVDGKRLLPINLAARSKERIAFDRAVLGMNPESVARYWIDRKIRGQSGPPKTIDAADLMQRVVGRLEGGIGYVMLDEVRPEVKAIRIDGRGLRDSSYPIEH